MPPNNTQSLIQTYLKQENEGVLLLHLNNVAKGASNGEFYDNTQENVSRLFRELSESLERCQRGLSEHVGAADAETIAKLLAIFTDEDVLTSGLYPRRVLWPKLQVAYIGNREGGIVFYDLLDEALQVPQASKALLPVFQYLLQHNYKGKHHSNPLKIKHYREALANLLDRDLVTGRVA